MSAKVRVTFKTYYLLSDRFQNDLKKILGESVSAVYALRIKEDEVEVSIMEAVMSLPENIISVIVDMPHHPSYSQVTLEKLAVAVADNIAKITSSGNTVECVIREEILSRKSVGKVADM